MEPNKKPLCISDSWKPKENFGIFNIYSDHLLEHYHKLLLILRLLIFQILFSNCLQQISKISLMSCSTIFGAFDQSVEVAYKSRLFIWTHKLKREGNEVFESGLTLFWLHKKRGLYLNFEWYKSTMNLKDLFNGFVLCEVIQRLWLWHAIMIGNGKTICIYILALFLF